MGFPINHRVKNEQIHALLCIWPIVDGPPVQDSIPISGINSCMRCYFVQLIGINAEMVKHHLHVGLMLDYIQNNSFFLTGIFYSSPSSIRAQLVCGLKHFIAPLNDQIVLIVNLESWKTPDGMRSNFVHSDEALVLGCARTVLCLLFF